MKVYDILVENQKTDEGPVRFLKRTLGKNTAMGKKAQVSAEIDGEVNKLYKSFMGDLSNFNDPNPTPKNLGQWIDKELYSGQVNDLKDKLSKKPYIIYRGEEFTKTEWSEKNIPGCDWLFPFQ